MLLMLATLAFGGGGGAYAELAPGAAWNDDTGPVTRGSALSLSVGGFWGPYRATVQYGRYNRVGLSSAVTSASPFLSGPESVLLRVGPEFGGGFDMLKVGAYWKVVVSPSAVIDMDRYEWEGQDAIDFGLSVRLAGGGIWWLDRRVGIVARLEAGPNYRLSSRASVSGGVGLGVVVRAGGVFRSKDEPVEEESFDPESIPWETVR